MWAANVDGYAGVAISDITYLVACLFQGGPEPVCENSLGGNETVSSPFVGGGASTGGWTFEQVESYVVEQSRTNIFKKFWGAIFAPNHFFS